MPARNQVASRLFCPVVGLDQHIDNIAKAGGEFFLVLHQSRPIFDDPGNAAGIKVAESFALTTGADEAGIGHNIVFGPVDLKVEVRLDLEGLTEIRVHGREIVIEERLSDHDHLGIGRNRVGS